MNKDSKKEQTEQCTIPDVIGRLKVISCKRPDYWYKNFIGKEFDIIGSSYNNYKVKRDIGDNWFVHGMDVKICL